MAAYEAAYAKSGSSLQFLAVWVFKPARREHTCLNALWKNVSTNVFLVAWPAGNYAPHIDQSCWREPRAELASSLYCFTFLNLTRTNVSTSKAIVQLVVVGDEVAHKSPEVCLSKLMHSTPPVYYENGPPKKFGMRTGYKNHPGSNLKEDLGPILLQ